MKNIIAVFVLISSLLFAAGCSNDFDMYADYKDITIVYSMVDISTDTTWVKITKAYTGPGNALLMAQNPDSSNYPYKLDASIVGKKNGSNLDPIVLDTLTIHNKPITDTIINENGDTTIINPFYSPNQLVYYGVGSLDKEAEYTLSINKNDSELTASTNLVNSFSVTSPVNRIAFTDSPTSPDGKIEWHSTKHGIRYEVLLRFNYLELSPGQEDTLKKHVDWFLGVVVAKSGNGDEELVETYSGPQFYSLLESELEPIPNVQRWVDDVDITMIITMVMMMILTMMMMVEVVVVVVVMMMMMVMFGVVVEVVLVVVLVVGMVVVVVVILLMVVIVVEIGRFVHYDILTF
jgi:hypothetical protein